MVATYMSHACNHLPERLDTHDGEEEVKGLRYELQGLGLCTWCYELILLTLQRHHATDGQQELPQALQELLTVFTMGAPANIQHKQSP